MSTNDPLSLITVQEIMRRVDVAQLELRSLFAELMIRNAGFRNAWQSACPHTDYEYVVADPSKTPPRFECMLCEAAVDLPITKENIDNAVVVRECNVNR